MKNITFPLSVALLGFLFASAVLLPHVLQRLDHEYPFQGISIMATDAETHYAARYREILDGHPELGNTYLSAPKDQPSVQPPLPEWSLAMLSRALPFDPVLSFVLLTGLCAFITFCTAVLMTASITGRRYESLAAVAVMLFAAAPFGTPWNVLNVLSSGSFADFGWLRFARPVNPLWTMPLFFTTVFFFSRWVRKAEILWIVCAAIMTTVLLYSYFYAWTYLLATAGVLFLFYAWKKEKKRLWHLLLYFALFLFLGSGYFLDLAGLIQHPWYLDSSRHQGLVSSRLPVVGAWLIALVVLSVLGKRIAWKEQFPLVLALALGGAIAMNQQVMTSQHLFPEHYHWYFVQPLGTLFFALLILLFARKHLRAALYDFFLCSIIAASLVVGFLQQRDTYGTYRSEWGGLQNLAPLFSYVGERVPKDTVAYSQDAFVMDLLPVYTSMNVYTSAQASNYLLPASRLRDMLFFTLWLQGIMPKDAGLQFPTTLRRTLGTDIYGSYYRELRGDYAALPDELVEEHVREYSRYYALPLQRKLSLYPLDYVIVSPSDTKTQQYRLLLSGGRSVYAGPGYELIELRK